MCRRTTPTPHHHSLALTRVRSRRARAATAAGIKAGEPVPLWKKIVAGGAAGAVASAIANPSDLMKVRLQTDGMAKDEAGKLLPKRYTGMVNCFMTVVKQEGVLALWTVRQKRPRTAAPTPNQPDQPNRPQP